ncbi:MAG: flavodoxin family protein [Candidatus Paraimprobicoccus trichonymphae]|uniref:Flavodoxin family protein n=1 Tax=Candidatus Paraimprobicoccus trichonymphae TaxID=3033793 RepID=A0AA48I2C5_9FIRM|nr:MAG: flavodoxin family protein [Candidatus Paraimprobicoccus trichonymphae]
MKKIFVYVGSRKGEFSNTVIYIGKILSKIKKTSNSKVSIRFFHPQNTKIENCMGCSNCFFYGKCNLDEIDDMALIKEEMLSSDIIIFGSPIYGANVSGDMKTFFDRISYWYHLFALRGKFALFVFTSCGNGVHFALNFSNSVMHFLGLNIIDLYNVIIFSPKQIDKDRDIIDKIIKTSNLLLEYLNDTKHPESNESFEMIFSAEKKYIETLENLKTSEYIYWRENKLLKCQTFSEVLNLENVYK